MSKKTWHGVSIVANILILIVIYLNDNLLDFFQRSICSARYARKGLSLKAKLEQLVPKVSIL